VQFSWINGAFAVINLSQFSNFCAQFSGGTVFVLVYLVDLQVHSESFLSVAGGAVRSVVWHGNWHVEPRLHTRRNACWTTALLWCQWGLYVGLSVCLSVSLSLCLSVCLSVCVLLSVTSTWHISFLLLWSTIDNIYLRLMDRRTGGRTDGRTDGWTDSYLVGWLVDFWIDCLVVVWSDDEHGGSPRFTTSTLACQCTQSFKVLWPPSWWQFCS